MKGHVDERDDMLVRPLEKDDIQPPVAAEPGEGPFDHPADAAGTNRHRGRRRSLRR